MDLEKELQYCMDKTAALMSQYLMRLVNKNGPVRNVDLLKRACQTELGATVSIGTLDVALPSKGPAIKAFCIRTTDSVYDICITPGQNSCWKRFVVCKELFHIVLDKEEYRSTELLPHIGEMTKDLPFNSGPRSPAVICEHLAEVGAMEYLLPFQVRSQEIATVQNGNYTPIAEKYKVPLVKVEQYLSQEYMAWLEPVSPKY